MFTFVSDIINKNEQVLTLFEKKISPVLSVTLFKTHFIGLGLVDMCSEFGWLMDSMWLLGLV